MKQDLTVIIGAGIAGLLAATVLRAAGRPVIVLDKGRGVGGRMATRRVADGRADHGAQYFTVRAAEFEPYVQRWLADGVIRQWSDGFYDAALQPHFNGDPRYIGVDGMTSVPKALAAALDVRTGVTVTAVRQAEAGFAVETVEQGVFAAGALIVTPPVPQSLAILAAGNVALPDAESAALQRIAYDPCFAVLAVLNRPSAIPAPGGLWPPLGHEIGWLADNRQKGISERSIVTIHGSAAFSRRHFEADRAQVGERLIAAAAPWLGATVVETQVHRWRYSIPTQMHPEPYLLLKQPAPLVFAGDAFAGPRVEGAARSGLLAAEALLAQFNV